MKMATVIRSVGSDFTPEVIDELLRRSRAKVDHALKHIRRPEAAVGVVKSQLGHLLVAVTARGLALNHYLDDRSEAAAAIAKLRLELDLVEDQSVIDEIGKEVDRYIAGEANALRRDVDLMLAGSAFQKKVLD